MMRLLENQIYWWMVIDTKKFDYYEILDYIICMSEIKLEIKVISLKKRLDRREFMLKNMGSRYPIEFYDAIYGGELESTSDLQKLFQNFTLPQYANAKCMMASILSHMNLWEESKKFMKTICIFEDDIEPSTQEIIDLEKICEEDFDIYFLSNIDLSINSFAYIIKPSGARKLHWYFGNKGFDDPLDREFKNISLLEFKPFKIKYTKDDFFVKTNIPHISKSNRYVYPE